MRQSRFKVGLATAIVWLCSQLTVAMAASDGASHRKHGHVDSFSSSLQHCRVQQPGRLNRRMALPATHPGIAGCLIRHGWHTDGFPLDRRLIDTQ